MRNISEERMQILKMIEVGKISAQEGLELMNALDQPPAEENLGTAARAKWIKIRVMTMDDRVKTKVNLPISLVDIGLKFGAANAPQMMEYGLDKIDIKALVEAVKNGAQGKIAEIEDEERQEKVEIYAE
ncbi:MAG: hypothetical protein KBA53_10895 [Thermoclostridium sp.]|nr:hypothetical protein [Thermoclostridium sp.]